MFLNRDLAKDKVEKAIASSKAIAGDGLYELLRLQVALAYDAKILAELHKMASDAVIYEYEARGRGVDSEKATEAEKNYHALMGTE
jgi:hypothetical protein